MQLSGNFTANLEINIVILTYKRLASLQRLILSLNSSQNLSNINLYISCEYNTSEEVLDYCKSISWPYGNFEIIQQTAHLGVDQHNLKAIAYAMEWGNCLVLEDDLRLSPYFFDYIQKTKVLLTDKRIAGISLYRYTFVEEYHLPFQIIPNEEFIYYQQRPSSKGCFYTAEMAKSFIDFNAEFNENFASYHLPRNVLNWGDEVWEKKFYCYLQAQGKYLAFPRFSLSTDYGDDGVHMNSSVHKYIHHAPLYLSSEIKVKGMDESQNVYDAFYEISPSTIRKWVPELEELEFECDIYGIKDLNKVKSSYLVSERNTSEASRTWGRFLKPELNNILLGQSGNHYSLAPTQSFSNKSRRHKLKENFQYYYSDAKLMDLLIMKIQEVKSRF